MMKLVLFRLFCLEAALAGTLSKALLEDWEVRSDLQYSRRTSVSWKQSTWGLELFRNIMNDLKSIIDCFLVLYSCNKLKPSNSNQQSIVSSLD